MHGGIFFNDDQGDSVPVPLCLSDGSTAMKSILMEEGGMMHSTVPQHRTIRK